MNAATVRLLLVVDDDDSMRHAVERLLGAAGWAPRSYASAEDLLAAEPASTPAAACIVSDYRLPAMSGLDLLAALRARGDATPFILVTAHDTPRLRDEALRRGASAYLAKPFPGGELLAAIEAAVNAPPNA